MFNFTFSNWKFYCCHMVCSHKCPMNTCKGYNSLCFQGRVTITPHFPRLILISNLHAPRAPFSETPWCWSRHPHA